MLAESILQRDGMTLGNLMISCDKYKCELKPISVAQRDSKGGVLKITGIAATPTPVDRIGGITETFPADVLERDGKTLEGRPIVDWHGEWPHRVRVKDIIGQVTRTWWDKTREALMFEGTIWNTNAMEVLQRKMMINFSPGYGAMFDTDSKGNKIARQIEFDHLGYLSRPADKKAELIKLAKEAVDSIHTEVLPLDTEDFSRAEDNELMSNRYFLELGYRSAEENDGKWGSRSIGDIVVLNSKLLREMDKRDIPWTAPDDLSRASEKLMLLEDNAMPDKDDRQGGTFETTTNDGHKHKATVDDNGIGKTDTVNGHKHGVFRFEVAEADGHKHKIVKDEARQEGILPKADLFQEWDGPGAEKRMKAAASSDGSGDKDKMDWKKYGHGFGYVEANADNFGMFHLPFADVIDGKMKAVWRGVAAAGAAVQGARGAQLSTEAKNSAKRTLGPYYKLFERKPPWSAARSDDTDDHANASPSGKVDDDNLDPSKRGDTMPEDDKTKKPADAGKGPDDKPKTEPVKDQKPDGDKAPEGADSGKRDDAKAATPKKDDAKAPVADDGKNEPKKDDKKEDKDPDGQRAAKDIPSGTATENLDGLIKTLRADSKNAEVVKLLEKAKETLEPKKPEVAAPAAREEDTPLMKEMREEIDKLKKVNEEVKREAHKSTVEQRVTSLIDRKSFVPGQREELIKLVDGMTDEAYVSFDKINEGREAYSTDDLANMTPGERAKQKDSQKVKEQEAYDAYVAEQKKSNSEFQGVM